MFRWIFSATIILLSTVGCPSSFAGGFVCGHDDETRDGGTALEIDSHPLARMVFVGFPGDNVSAELTTEHQEILSTIQTYYANLSRGSFTFHDDSNLILKPGESIETGATAWMASAPADSYATDTLQPGYEDCSSWLYKPGDNWCTALCAEIMTNIKEAYEDSVPDYLDNTDYLIMILLTRGNPFGDNIYGTTVEGRATIPLLHSGLANEPFFDGLAHDGNTIRGTIQLFVTETGAVFSARESSKGIAHEIGHTLGAMDGPPNQYHDHPPLAKYLYGNRNLMCQTSIPGEGIPPIGLGWLQYLDWRGGDPDSFVQDFAGENLVDHRMVDISLPGGHLYRFKPSPEALPDSSLENQYFLLAYHSQTGWIDTQTNEGGEPLLRGPGIEIWHCIGDAMFDMESASGLFQDPVTPGSSNLPLGWQLPDPVSGFDNHDIWPGIYIFPDSFARRDPVEYAHYAGEADDFFRLDSAGPEFSNSTNPSSRWYGDGGSEIVRRNPQNRPNPLTVDILQDNGDGSIQVNLLTGPYESVWVAYPDPEKPELAPGDSLRIYWENEHSSFPMTSVEIYFSGDGGANYQKITETPVPYADHECYWQVPASTAGTQHGWLKVVFFNEYSPLGGPFVYPEDHIGGSDPAPIHIGGSVAIEENVLAPVDGSTLFANKPVRVEWSAFFNDADHGGFGPTYDVEVNSVDLAILQGGTWVDFATGLVLSDSIQGPGYYQYDGHSGVNYTMWTPTGEFVVPDGRIRLTLNYQNLNSGAYSSSRCVGEEEFGIYPLAIQYVDHSKDAQLLRRQEGGYIGIPNVSSAMDCNGDGFIDFFLGMESGDDPLLDLNYNGVFQKALRPFLDSGAIGQGQKFAIHGDFNWDGSPDLFCGHGSEPRLYLNGGPNSQPLFMNVEGSLTSEVQALLPGTESAVWLDLDHDQDLDLILGRAGSNGIGGDKVHAPDYLLINNGPLSSWEAVGFGVVSTTLAVAAMDYDQDGFWEIVVGADDPDKPLLFYKETVSGEFVVRSPEMPTGNFFAKVNDLAWVDINNDGWFDLVANEDKNTAVIFINDQSGGFLEALNLGEVENVEFQDFDGDGWMDYLSSVWDEDQGCDIWMNLGGLEGFPEGFVNTSEAVGLRRNGVSLNSLVSAPFSSDAAPDIFMPRQDDDARLLVAVDAADSSASLNPSFVTIRLVQAGSTATPYPAYGATIKLWDGEGRSQSQRVESEAGFGSQKPQALTFGIRNFVGLVSGSVHLPEEREVAFSFDPSDPNFEGGFLEVEIPALSPSMINVDLCPYANSVLLPVGRRDIHFNWTTDLRCSNLGDKVFIFDVPEGCGLPDTLSLASPLENQDYNTFLCPDGKYHHEIILRDIPCQPSCGLTYQVQSSIGDVLSTSSLRSLPANSCSRTVPVTPGIEF